MHVEIYSKPGCTLCVDAWDVLERARAQVPFTLQEVNIEEDAALFARYRYDIPVVFVDGHKAFKHRLTEEAVLHRLRRASPGTPVAHLVNQDGQIPTLPEEK